CYLNLFVFSMLLLVLGDSFLLMFFGWEGVGLCSYLLIGFWYTDFAKATAGIKAFVVNRIGDFAFVTGLFLLFCGLGGSWDNPGLDSAAIRYEQKQVEVLRKDPGAEHEEGHAEPESAAKLDKAMVTFGPTVSFHELREQLSLQDASSSHPIAD